MVVQTYPSTHLSFLFALFYKFFELSSVRDSCGLCHTVDNYYSFDMVVLMLESPCVEPFGFFAVE